MADTIRVLLVDDCAPIRWGVRWMLERVGGVAFVGEATDGRTALDMIEREQPAAVMLDCRLPDLPGMKVAAMVREKGFAARILAYSAYEDDAEIRGMLDAGAAGYVLKEEPPAKVIEAIQTVARGGQWFSQRVAAKIAEWMYSSSSPLDELTKREQEILRLLTQGLTNQEMADQLGLAERTVRFHLRNIYAKLNVRRRSGAVAWALRNGYGENT